MQNSGQHVKGVSPLFAKLRGIFPPAPEEQPIPDAAIDVSLKALTAKNPPAAQSDTQVMSLLVETYIAARTDPTCFSLLRCIVDLAELLGLTKGDVDARTRLVNAITEAWRKVLSEQAAAAAHGASEDDGDEPLVKIGPEGYERNIYG